MSPFQPTPALAIHLVLAVLCCGALEPPQRTDLGREAQVGHGGGPAKDRNEASGPLGDALATDEPTSFFEENSLTSQFNKRITFDAYITYTMRALTLVAGFDNDLHRYDTREDLLNSFAHNQSQTESLAKFGAHFEASEASLMRDQSELLLAENERNQVECGNQLEKLILDSRQLFESFESFSNSKQLNLIDFLDSYGSLSSQLMKGNTMWLGSYDQCSRSTLNVDNTGQAAGARYCVANLRSPSWPTQPGERSDRLGGQSIKLGVCLPRACNSISILRHSKRIESLIKIVRLNQIPFSGYKLTGLFCLPDESSPLRQLSNSARWFIACLSTWLAVVTYYSLKYEYLRMRWLSENGDGKMDGFDTKLTNPMRIFPFRLSVNKLFESSGRVCSVKTNEFGPIERAPAQDSTDSEHESGIDTSDTDSSDSRFEHVPSNPEPPQHVRTDSGNRSSSLVNDQMSKYSGDHVGTKANTMNVTYLNKSANRREHKSAVVIVHQNENHSSESRTREPTVDLSAIDGIKVLSMVWLISAHSLLFFIRTIANGRDFWSVLKDARFMTVMAGIFPVDTFFTITGVLTAYLKFNKDNGNAIGRTKYWLEAFSHRYFRFMPMYLLVFWYTRDVSEFIGGGPLWDYATAETSLRSICKQESVTVPLLFQANFKPIDQHCVKPAWYLANDYQYLLLTPLFMGLILKSPILGYLLIAVSICASLIMQFLTVFYSTDMDDFSALINFKPMFGAYVLKNLWKLYVLPYNRIPPYLIGILTGHLIYSLKRSVQRRLQSANLSKTKEAQTSYVGFNQTKDSVSSLTSARQFSNGDNLTNSRTKHDQGSSYLRTLAHYIHAQVWTPLVFLISIIYLPMLTRILTQEGLYAKVGTSSIMAVMRLVWSISIARLIYICATRRLMDCKTGGNNSDRDPSDSFIIRFLSSPGWKPWSKIGLSALLIQWEIISYLAQIQTSAPNMTITFLLAIVLVCIAATYSLALLIYLTLEYPLSQIERLYIHPALFNGR